MKSRVFFSRIYLRFFSSNRPFRLTRGGWVFILYTIGVGAGAINTGNNLLYLVFGIFLGLILASGALSDTNLWMVDVEWLCPQSVEAGEPCILQARITNEKKRLPVISATIMLQGELKGTPMSHELFVPSLGATKSIVRDVILTPSHRGYFSFKTVQLSTQFPFGLLRKRWTIFSADEKELGFFVTPKTHPVDLHSLLLSAVSRDPQLAIDRRGDGQTASGVRDYVLGDNARRIHWKASARRGSFEADTATPWLVRETDRDAREDLIFQWPALTELAGMDERAREKFIEFVASLVREGKWQGHGVVLHVEGHRVVDIWKYLSVVDPLTPARSPYLDAETTHPQGIEMNLLLAFRRWK